MIIGAAMPWLDPETLGPFNPWHYAYVYLLVCVPTLFVTGAGFFAIATATRSMMWTYVGVIAFLVLYLVASDVLLAPRVRARRGADRPVRPRRPGPGDQVLDRRRAQHAAAGIHRLHPVEPRAVDRRRLCAARARLDAVLARAPGAVAWLRRKALASKDAEPAVVTPPTGTVAASAATTVRGSLATRRLVAALGADEIRHDRRGPQPGLHRAARHRLRERDRLAVVRRRDLRQHDPSGHAGDDRDAERRVHDHPADHRDLLRGRAGLARPRPAHARDHRLDAGPRLGVRGAEDPRDLAGAVRHARRRARWPQSPCRR